jgi:hypothetical protein
MKTRFILVLPLVLALSIFAWSQRPSESQRSSEPKRSEEPRSGETQSPAPSQNQPRANQGRIPAPPAQRVPNSAAEVERRDGGRTNNLPCVWRKRH